MTIRDSEYVPTEDEEYMNDRQIRFFQKRLGDWREQMVEASQTFFANLRETTLRKPDEVEASATQSGMALDLQARFRQHRIMEQIDYALSRIEDGEYGYCEMTGEEIGIKRLLARPTATLCVEVQEQHERLTGSILRYTAAC